MKNGHVERSIPCQESCDALNEVALFEDNRLAIR